jgi:rod shape-determining protein MreC
LNSLSDAARKSLYPRGPGLGLKFLLFAALSIGMIVADYRGDARLRPLRDLTARLLQPLLWVTSLPRATAGLGDHLHSREELLAENQALQKQQLELEGRVLRMDALEAENERIRELLSSAASLQIRVLIAEILSVNQDPYHQVVLNKGERDGVYKGQAVVDASGIMGQVTQVNPSTAVALLITDPEHSTPVEVNRTGLQTIARGAGQKGLNLPFLSDNADVKVGDLLVSSGLGGRFPAGYPVGVVSNVEHRPSQNFMLATAWPSARLNQGHQALLVWSERPTLPAGADERNKPTAAAPPKPAAQPKPEAAPKKPAPSGAHP